MCSDRWQVALITRCGPNDIARKRSQTHSLRANFVTRRPLDLGPLDLEPAAHPVRLRAEIGILFEMPVPLLLGAFDLVGFSPAGVDRLGDGSSGGLGRCLSAVLGHVQLFLQLFELLSGLASVSPAEIAVGVSASPGVLQTAASGGRCGHRGGVPSRPWCRSSSSSRTTAN